MEHCHARSGAVAQFRLRGRCRRLHPRRRTRPPHPIDRQPADQAAGGRCRPAAAQPQRQGRDADRSRRAAVVLCAAAAGAGGRSARRGGAPRERGRGAARCARGFRRLSAGQIAGGIFALASRPAARRARRPEHQSASAISNAANSIWRCSSAPPAKRAASRCGRSACTGSPARAIRAIPAPARCR